MSEWNSGKLSSWQVSDTGKAPQDLTTDAELIALVLDGQSNIFEMLLNRYRSYIWAIASRLLPEEVVPDIAQETFIEAYRSLARYDGSKPLKNWLAGIALNRCRDHWRQSYRRNEIPISSLSEEHQLWLDQVCSQNGEDVYPGLVDRPEARDILDYALSKLSDKDRMVITLVHWEGFSIKEVAQMLSWSTINVKVRAYRSRTKLRKLLGTLLTKEA